MMQCCQVALQIFAYRCVWYFQPMLFPLKLVIHDKAVHSRYLCDFLAATFRAFRPC